MTHEARVKELMENKVPWYFLTKEQKECFRKVGKSYCLYHSWCTGAWELAGIDEWTQMDVYRIKKDYQPEPKIFKCEIKLNDIGNCLGYFEGAVWSCLFEAQADPDFNGFEDRLGNVSYLSPWFYVDSRYEIAKYVLFRSK